MTREQSSERSMSEEAQCEHELYGERCRLIKGHSGLHDREFGMPESVLQDVLKAREDLLSGKDIPVPIESVQSSDVRRADVQVQELLAFAWSLFNLPLWEAQQKMRDYLDKEFGAPTGAAAEMLPGTIEQYIADIKKLKEHCEALAAQKEAPDAACKYCAEGLFPLKKYFDGRMMHFDGLMAWYPCARPVSQTKEAGK